MNNKEKVSKQNEENIPDVKREGWEAEELIEESANQESDEVVQKIVRGDKSDVEGDDEIIDAPDFDDTPRGRQEKVKDNENKHH